MLLNVKQYLIGDFGPFLSACKTWGNPYLKLLSLSFWSSCLWRLQDGRWLSDWKLTSMRMFRFFGYVPQGTGAQTDSIVTQVFLCNVTIIFKREFDWPFRLNYVSFLFPWSLGYLAQYDNIISTQEWGLFLYFPGIFVLLMNRNM